MNKMDTSFPTVINGPLHADRRHDSAHKHVAGAADYIDDMPEPAGMLHAAIGMTDRAHAIITSMDLSAVESAPGVIAVLTAKDFPVNDVSSAHKHDEPVLTERLVEFHGQPAFVVIAETRAAARQAARQAFVASVTKLLPPVSRQIRNVSIVPKQSSPFAARARAPFTLESSQESLVPEK